MRDESGQIGRVRRCGEKPGMVYFVLERKILSEWKQIGQIGF